MDNQQAEPRGLHKVIAMCEQVMRQWWFDLVWPPFALLVSFGLQAHGSIYSVDDGADALIMFGWMAGFFATVFGLVRLLLSYRVPVLRWTALGAFVIVFAGTGITFMVTRDMLWNHRLEAYDRVGKAAAPLIQAILAYEQDYTTAPANLTRLVPKYIKAIPKPPLPRDEEYHYYSPAYLAEAGYTEPVSTRDRWRLTVNAGLGMNFDWFEYRPSGKYPKEIGGNRYERVGDWAYVHE